MKRRHDALIPLSHHHHHGLVMAQRLKRSRLNESLTLEEIRNSLQEFWFEKGGGEHFRLEEEVLLPVYAQYGSVERPEIVEVLTEHIHIRSMIGQIIQACEPEEEFMKRLGILLESHIHKEEQVVFPFIEQTIPEEVLNKIDLSGNKMSKPLAYQPKLDLTDWKKADDQESARILSVVSPELHSFIREHRNLSQLMDEVRSGYEEEVYQKALSKIAEELEHHFRYEEQFVLPRLVRHIGTEEVGPAAKIKQEHATIRRHYQEASELMQQVANGNSPEKTPLLLVQKINLLAYLLKKHIEKEDHYLFPMTSLIFTPSEKSSIALDVQEAEHLRK